MTAPRHPQAAEGPGVVRVRLSGQPGAPEAVAALLATCPGAEILTGPDGPYPNRRQPGHRLYLTIRVRETEVRAQLEGGR